MDALTTSETVPAMPPTIGALVLAAGKGTRMYSDDPKVLRTLLGEPMLAYVLDSLLPLFGERAHVVVGFGANKVRAAFPEMDGRFVEQREQLGTGHALQCAWGAIKEAGYEYLLVLNGDVPLIGTDDIKTCIDAVTQTKCGKEGHVAGRAKADLAFLTTTLSDPGAYGRVVRKTSGQTVIVEAKDYDEKAHGPVTGEINAGIYCLRVSAVDKVLFDLTNVNKSGEFYITDLTRLVAEAGGTVVAVNRGNDENLLGINTPAELVRTEETLRARIVEKWLSRGVVIRQKESVRIGPKARLAPGCELCGPCDILGQSIIWPGAVIAPHVWIKDSEIGERTKVHAFSHLEGVRIGQGVEVGPFARLRPGAVLAEGSRVGNFVELKKTVIGPNAKAGHLTYLGDAEIGADVNVGAGTITCNYDGKNKFKTVIGKNAFIGSNTALVAPVNVGENALVAAGSVITEDVPDNALAIARGRLTIKKRKDR